MTIIVRSMCIAVSAFTAAFWCAAQDKGRPAQFDIKVGDRKYDIGLDKPLEVTTPNGEHVTIVLHQKETLDYSDRGLSFKYPSDMEMEEQRLLGTRIISLDSKDSPFAALHVLSDDADEDEWRKDINDELKEQFEKLS